MKQCEVLGCQKETGAFFVLCKEHWKLVPLNLKDEINEAYRVRQKHPERYETALKKAMRGIDAGLAN